MAAMTNAERQKRYRDKQRGSPAGRRWSGHLSARVNAYLAQTSRTAYFMGLWILNNAPDVLPESGKAREAFKITPAYKRLRSEYELGILDALSQPHDESDQLVYYRLDGKFHFEFQSSSPSPHEEEGESVCVGLDSPASLTH
jgi:hypothetical protein